jgi:septal ring factor EnvC (AmiA/AmiB activator)
MAKPQRHALAPVVFAIGIVALFISSAAAQPAGSARRLTQVERERGQAAETATRLRTEASATQREIARLDRRLAETAQRRAAAEVQAADAEVRLIALRARAARESRRYGQNRDALEQTLIAAAFSERRPEPRAQRQRLLAALLAPSLGQDIRSSRAIIADAQSLEAQIQTEQAQLAEAQTAIDAERAQAETMIAQRRALRTTQLADASAAERRARQLAREATSLRQLAQRATASTTRVAAARPGVLPAAWAAPAQGRISTPFGDRSSGAVAAQGATLRTRVSAQVLAPAAAEIAYAGQFRSYGQVLILNVDGGYAIVLAGLESLRARTGERVTAGQMIGEMSASATPAPELYVEVRRDGRVVDPSGWLQTRGAATQTASAR